jgi:hypothetical protein
MICFFLQKGVGDPNPFTVNQMSFFRGRHLKSLPKKKFSEGISKKCYNSHQEVTMKKTCFVLLIVFLAAFICAGTVIPLHDLVKPWTINVDKARIYITEGLVVYIYGKGDFKLIKKFGRRGEGPGEFKANAGGLEWVDLFLHPDHLVINSFHRVSLFTRQGEYIKQIDGAAGNTFQPLEKKYVGQKYLVDNKVLYNTIWLYDSNFQKIKEIYRCVHGFQRGKSFNAFTYYPIVYKTYKNKVFLDGRDGNLYIFDQTGEKSAACKLETEKIQVTDQDRERYIQYFKTHPDWKDLYMRRLKGLLKFSEYFPVIRVFHVADDRIYILTYKEDKGKSEWLIMDMQGKLEKKIFLPVSFMNVLDIYPYTIEGGKLYQLIENEDEEWELHILSIRE